MAGEERAVSWPKDAHAVVFEGGGVLWDLFLFSSYALAREYVLNVVEGTEYKEAREDLWEQSDQSILIVKPSGVDHGW